VSNVGFATVSIVPSAKGFQAALNKEIGPETARAGKSGGDKAGKGFRSGFLGSLKGMAAPLAAVIGVGAIGGLLKGAIDQASGLQEAGTALKTVFGEGYGEIMKYGAQGAATLGQSKLDALKAAQSFGVYGKAAGLSGKENAKFSGSLVGLGTDLASFYDSSPEEAIAAIGSGLRGEAEPLRRFGVLLDDATLKSQAMKMGLIKTTKEALSPANKVLAAQAVIMKQSKVAQGDFAKTSGGLANQQRILSASIDDLKGNLGQKLLPIATKATKWAADFAKGMSDGSGAGGAFAKKIGQISGAVKGFVADWQAGTGTAGQIRGLFETARDAVTGFIDEWKTGEGTAGKIRAAFERVKFAVDGFITSFKSGQGTAGTFRSVLEGIGKAIGGVVSAGASILSFLAQHTTTVKIAAGAIGALILVTELHGAVLAVQAAGGLASYIKGTRLVTGLTKTWAAAQWLMNAALTANPIGIVIVALVAIGVALVVAYKKSETFRNIVNRAFDLIKIGALQMALGIVQGTRFIVNAFLSMVGSIVTGAAQAFGWVPGLGPKLKAAAAKVEGFKTSANASLAKVEKDLKLKVSTAEADAKINAFRRRQSASIKAFFDVTTRNVGGRVNVNGVPTNAGMREHGGPVTKGNTYMVGEKRPEWFVPNSNGRIVTDDPSKGGGGSSAPAGPVHVTSSITIGKREFASLVAEANIYNKAKGGQ